MAIGYFDRMDPVLASALTPLHPGAGRAPGVVDLPVQRDPYGYPLIPASSIKGALKTQAGQRRNCISGGRVACSSSDCRAVCCIFGPEPGEGDEGASAVSIIDFFPLAIPVPSLEYGYVYVTTPMLLARAKAILEASSISNMFTKLYNVIDVLLGDSREVGGHTVLAPRLRDKGESITLGLEKFTIATTSQSKSIEEVKLDNLNPLYQARPLVDNLVVVGDDVAPTVIERGLIRVTRISIDREKKTVTQRALWTEEYLPPGSLFIGAVAFTRPRNKYCNGISADASVVKDMFLELLGAASSKDTNTRVLYASIGGKETIGKGLMKLMIA
ncbi:type III-B CRISPR module RAMP protein Cmr4 [Pyrodictium delaneyi]|uniref:type III-B CRISPR module RAMP protein Cmr4 n=1 Tax=Pyrodictium delaneyi TaxID=1273541 RepID=UPI00117B73D9|nr:type III-B CRISPR module RAMP protein Cmr4 [Pyrodictium delaneyi]